LNSALKMYDISKVTTEDLRFLRRFLLYRFATLEQDDDRKNECRLLCDKVSHELVQRTGDSKYKL